MIHWRVAKVGRWVLGLVALTGLWIGQLDAHKGNTSKYTFDDDVFPILRVKCGQCHVEGGSAPMSLMFYSGDGGAVAWAQSMKEMVLAEAMPPWFVDATGPAIKGAHTLSAHEMDVLVTWASGGTPQGDLHRKPPPMVAHTRWGLGPPDISLPLPSEVVLGPGQLTREVDVTVPVPVTEATWLAAADLFPGNPGMVRSATIAVDAGPVPALWEPGDDPLRAPSGTGWVLHPGAKLRIHLLYKKSYLDEQQRQSDRSTIGLYLARGKALHAIDSLVMKTPQAVGQSSDTPQQTLTAGRLLAIRLQVDQPYATFEVDAVTTAGTRTPLLKLRGVRPEWPRRYWLQTPIVLPASATLDIHQRPADSDTGPLGPAVARPLQIALDLVAR